MNITLGTTNDPPAVIGKSVVWGEQLGAPVTRETISTRDPVIIVTGYEITPATNYARIVWGETDTRYYFITAVEKLTGNRTRIKMRVDVLETYRDKIGALSVVAERASSFANRYIADSIQQTSAKPQIIFKQFNGNTPFISDSVTSATRCIVVRAVAREVVK